MSNNTFQSQEENKEIEESKNDLQQYLIEAQDGQRSNSNEQSIAESEVNLNKSNLMGEFPGIWQHTKILLWKNFIIQKRNLKSLLFILFGPLIICSIIIGFQYLADDQTQHSDKSPPLHPMQPIIPCAKYSDDPDNCFTFGYGVIGNENASPWIDYAINFVAKVNKMNRTKEFRNVLSAQDGAEYNNKYIKYFNTSSNQGLFDYGIVFCSDTFMEIPRLGTKSDMIRVDCRKANFQMDGNVTYDGGKSIDTIQKSYFYTIVYNNTWEMYEQQSDTVSSFSFPKDGWLITLKALLDSAIINYEQGIRLEDYEQDNNPSSLLGSNEQNSKVDENLMKLIRFNITNQSYAFPSSRFYDGFNIINQMGAFYYFLMPMYLFVQIQGDIVMEKQRRLRAGLNIQGVSHTAFYLSWFLTSITYSILISILQIVTSLIFQFDFFLDTPFFILFFLFFFFTLSMQVFGYFIATIMPNTNKSYSFSYGFVLFAVVIELFLSKPDAIIPYLYNTERPAWIMLFVFFLNMYSPFQYTLIFVAISQKSGIHFDSQASVWTRGSGYTWSDITDTLKGQERGINFEAPCPLQSFLLLLLMSFVYGVLTWYFDHIISSNRGSSHPWYFLFTPSYWRGVFNIRQLKRQSQSYLFEQNEKPESSSQRPQSYLNDQSRISNNQRYFTVHEEEERVRNRFFKDEKCDGLRIFNIKKNFIEKRSIFKKPNIIRAVRGLSLEIGNNEILGLLGHNGAGKTTLLNMLCGLLNPTSGSVVVNNYSLSEELEKIRQIIGICPQFDILWDDLTGLEHLALFARIKGMNPKYIDKIGNEMLKMVQLEHVANAYSRTYSGGMKRRLSLAISAQGNPKVILLDEPTTGMDPKSKKEVWNLIQAIRKNKSIILTTHSMEEADVLSDRIAIMVSGQIQAIGTSLKLKDLYGGGYRMHLIIKNPTVNSEEVQKFLNQNFPTIKLLKESSGSMIFVLPDKQVVKKIFEMFELYESPLKNKLNSEEVLDSTFFKSNLMIDKSRVQDLDFQMDQQNMRYSLGFFEMIEDWGISHPTIEDVFIQVTDEEQQLEEEEDKQNQEKNKK
ncbi:transporter family ABC domain protein (macronuclear) [Tetrahymena thermophila SB210]|uniref:Transporter family ABC domain protein n=1 Tax=Tetrahymena thermophila (strain SB210) TaxID=312017 RepID=Q23DB9_TETTS|nr:transporter family ABC domain protein [Tetrahymena thermophila SB210]EAR94681.1 transporter family ABC domain protein [Tetrahymena thermophila SB210]|eukprot:XP_001014767.1 transporter family ABC domain protein [Tetrahymena thermophila SB210]